MKCSVFAATSVDGFLARADGGMDWLDRQNARVSPGEDAGFGAFLASVDVLVMGRETFEFVRAFPAWPYGALRVVVLTRRPLDLPPALRGCVSASAEEVGPLVERLEREGHRHAYVDGGQTVRRFLHAGLVDELTVTVVPVLLGTGRSLLGGTEVELELVASQAFPFGFVQSRYRVVRRGGG